jgi:phosphoglycolate phosphatase
VIVLFDIDGTLIDPRGAGRRSLNACFHRLYGRPGAAEDVTAAGQTDAFLFPAIARSLGVPWEPERVFPAYLQALAEELPRGPARVLPGVPELCAALRARADVVLGLQTGNIRSAAEMKLEYAGLRHHFAFGGFGEDGPDRGELVRAAIARSGRAGEAVVVVGDAPNDIAAARAAGARAVAVATGWHPRRDLEALGPDAVLPDLADTSACLAALSLGAG